VIIRTKLTDLHISNYSFAVLPLILATGFIIEYIIAFLSIAIHELAHVAAALARGYKIRFIKFLPVGLSVSIDESFFTRHDSIIIYCSGPIVNLLLSVISYAANLFLPYKSEYLHFFTLSNIYLAVFNMIPAIPLDGGRILQQILSKRIGLISAGKYLRSFTFILSTVFIILGIYQLILSRMNFSLFVIGIYIMFLFKTGRMEASLMNMKQIIYRRSRLLKKGIYPVRDLVVMKSVFLGDTVKSMDFDRFHFIYVLDDNLKLLGVFSENDIMESMLRNNGDITFEELIRNEKYRLENETY